MQKAGGWSNALTSERGGIRIVLPTMTRLILTLLAAAATSVVAVDAVDVFPAGLNGVALYRIPGVVVTGKGTVLAYCEARKNSGSDWGEIEIHLRRSLDGGLTWERPQQIAHRAARLEGNPRKKDEVGAHEQTVNNPVAIVDRDTGAIEFLYCINYARCFSMRSTDDGVTWSDPVDITASFEPLRAKYPWKVVATGPGHGIQMKGGRLVVPIWLAYGKEGDHSPSASATIYSDDHGKTWLAGEVAVPNEGEFVNPNETMIARLSDDRVMLLTRSVSKPNRKIVTTSADGATGWARPTFHPDLWEPVCMASIVSHPTAAGTLLFSCPRRVSDKPAGRGKREQLSIMLSRDDGKTWPVLKLLEEGPSAYSDLTVLPDGSVLCLYEGNKTIKAARFGLDWLTQP